MKSLFFVLKEHKNNLYKMFKLATYDFIAPFKDTYLGLLWIILNPLTQIGAYWFVFGMGIRGGAAVDGHDFLLWMLAGLIPWFYVSSGILSGGTSIYGKAGILTKMKFPTSIIPTYSTLTQLMNNIPVVILMFIIYAVYDYQATIYYVQIIYYLLAATMFIIAFSLLNSALVMAMRDINKLIGTVMRFLFYFTPILWTIDKMSPKMQNILMLNPIIYLIDGFRNSLLYNKWFWEDVNGTIYFWGFTLIILFIGAIVHMRLRNRFSDLV